MLTILPLQRINNFPLKSQCDSTKLENNHCAFLKFNWKKNSTINVRGIMHPDFSIWNKLMCMLVYNIYI